MLEEGLRAGLAHLGIASRVVVHVEREAAAAAQLATLMQAGCLDDAPIWDDLTTFDGRPWRGRVDCIVAGFPCQPWSVAGKQAGQDDHRWIWPDIARIIREVEPALCFLENVPGLVQGGGLEPVLFDLAQSGFDAQWCHLEARAVGASHKRERVFILAYRPSYGWGEGRAEPAREPRRSDIAGDDGAVGNTGREHFDVQQRRVRAEPARADNAVEFAERTRWTPAGRGYAFDAGCEPLTGCSNMEHSPRESQHGSGQHGPGRRAEPAIAGRHVADSRSARPQGRELDGSCNGNRGGQEAHGSASELCGAFAPGPADERWFAIIAERPWLAPATKPGVRMLVAGLALLVDESRTDQLREIGNGVVATQAAAAFASLARRAMKP